MLTACPSNDADADGDFRGEAEEGDKEEEEQEQEVVVVGTDILIEVDVGETGEADTVLALVTRWVAVGFDIREDREEAADDEDRKD